jgi:tetratricopeptide (TPR) repeat protein
MTSPWRQQPQARSLARHATMALLFIVGSGGGGVADFVQVAAQEPGQGGVDASTPELERLREAAALEQAGNLAGAERIVTEVLAVNPASLTALLTLERLVSVQGRPGDVLPAAERLLVADPGSMVGHQIRLRVLARDGDDAAVAAAAAAWIRAAPNVETPYREAALVWRQRGQHRRAVQILQGGRRHVVGDDALALELGDAYAAAGDLRRAASEWARAVGADGRGFMLVQRRLHELPDGGARAIPLLVEQLGRGDAPGRRRAAALLAIEARREDLALQHGAALVAGVPPAEAEPYATELARRADHAGLHRLAAWAWGELLRHARDPAATLALRSRIAELALLAGDTAGAAAAYEELERATAAGSPQRRQAMALRIQVSAREGDLAGAAAELNDFRTEFPQAAELDTTTALIAGLHVDAGDAAAAERLLAGVPGPHSARLRGRLAIRAGDLAVARDELLAAAAQLHGAAATETLALAALLMRLTPRGGELVARYIGVDDAEREALVRGAAEETRPLPPAERAPVLEFIAGLADRAGMRDDADALRREVLAAAPRSHEAAGALLTLARRAQEQPGGADDARILLERLILDHPRSTLAPQARQELQRLGRGSPTS